jgi:hypothetical protein
MSSRNLLHGFAMDGDQYREMYQKSIDDPAGFWSEIADEFYWKQKWSPDEVCAENLDVTKGPIKIEVGYSLISMAVSGGGRIHTGCGWLLVFGICSGSRGERPTYATMRSTAMWRLGMGTRSPCTGRGMSPVRMGSSPTLNSWKRFAR